jgi:hypothetical protein
MTLSRPESGDPCTARLLEAVTVAASLGRRSEASQYFLQDLLLEELHQQHRFSNTSPIFSTTCWCSFKQFVYSLQEDIYRKFEATKTLL